MAGDVPGTADSPPLSIRAVSRKVLSLRRLPPTSPAWATRRARAALCDASFPIQLPSPGFWRARSRTPPANRQTTRPCSCSGGRSDRNAWDGNPQRLRRSMGMPPPPCSPRRSPAATPSSRSRILSDGAPCRNRRSIARTRRPTATSEAPATAECRRPSRRPAHQNELVTMVIHRQGAIGNPFVHEQPGSDVTDESDRADAFPLPEVRFRAQEHSSGFLDQFHVRGLIRVLNSSRAMFGACSGCALV